MASGRELLAVTDAALQSLLAGGTTDSQEGLDIFSPLINFDECQQSGNSSLSVASHEALLTETISTPVLIKSSESPTAGALTHEGKNRTSATSTVEASEQLANKTLSPLTISAQDINAGSMDFTEFAATLHVSGDSACSTPLLCKTGKENLSNGTPESGQTTPMGSSTAVPIRVRVSAKKLREIQSPYCSSGGSNAGSITGSPSSLNAAEGGIPRALSRTRDAKEGRWRYLSAEQLKPTQKSLQQGVLQKMTPHEDLSPSDDSLIVSATASKTTTKEVKKKLLARQSHSEEVPLKARAIVVPKMVHPAGTSASASRCDDRMCAAEDQLPPTAAAAPAEKPWRGRNARLGGQPRRELIQLPGDNGMKFKLSPSLCQLLPGSGLAASSSPSELTPTSKLVATCATVAAKAAATATAAALTSSREKPRETGNTRAEAAQVPESFPSAPKTNSIPLAPRGASNQHKYSLPANDGDERADENTAELARKDGGGGGVKESPRREHPRRSLNDDSSGSDSWESEDGRVLAGKSKSEQTRNFRGKKKYKAYESKHRTKPHYRDAQTRKQTDPGVGEVGPAALHELGDDKLPSHYSQAYSTDVLRRLQRLEELQHRRTVETFEKQRGSKEGTLLRNAEFTNTAHTACQTDILPSGPPLSWPPSHVTVTLPRFMPDHTSRKQAATLGQLEPLKEERREGPVGAAKISQESAERLSDCCPQQHPGNNKKGLADNIPEPMQYPQQLVSADRESVDKHVVDRDNKYPMMMTHDGQVISRAERVLSEVQLARGRLELQCALQEAEAQLVDLEKYSHSLRERENGLPLSSEVQMRVGEIISTLEREKAESAETNSRSEGIQQGVLQTVVRAGGRQPREALGRKPLASSSSSSTMQPGRNQERNPSKVSLKKAADGKQARAAAGRRKRVEGETGGTRLSRKTELKATTKAPGVLRHSDTVLPSNPAVAPRGPSHHHPLLPAVPPPSLPLLHSGVTGALPACLGSDTLSRQPSHPSRHPPGAMPPSVVVPLGRPSTHHLQNTAFSRPSASQGSEHTAVVPSVPLPFPVAIPLGVPRILPSRETPYCVHVEEKAVESEGIRSENTPPPKLLDACQQTSDVSVLDYPPQPSGATATQLVVETLPGVDISGDTPSREAEQSEAASEDTWCSAGTHDDIVISVEGQHFHAPSPPRHGLPFPPPPPLLPSHPSTEGREGERLTSDELDERLRDNMQKRAMEWVQQELLARVLAQTDITPDPVPTLLDHTPNSCSTCTTPPDPQDLALAPVLGEAGLQLFVDCGIPVDRRVVLQMVREAVLQQAAEMARESDEASETKEESQDFSYTPPESEGIRSSSPSEPTTPLLSTPHPSPPPSLSHEHTLIADESISEPAPPLLPPNVTTPTATPPPSPKSESLEELLHESISTPQATEDEQEVSLATDTVSRSHTREVTPTPSHTYQSLPTPSATPISEPTSPESLPQEVTPIHAHTQEPSLSASPTSSSTALSHSHNLSQATSSATTDREISMGEYILHRPPFQPPANTASLSEGEVPLSPGDARWYALRASKVGARPGVARTERKRRSKPDEAIIAFLDLKNTPDPSSDSSQFSDSLQSDSKGRSEGEIRRPSKPAAIGNDPFEKFLAKLDISNPGDSSTPTAQTLSRLEEDNTLSEMPSIGAEEKGHLEFTPLNTANERRHSRGKAPYHELYPIQKPGHRSPGEAHHQEMVARSLRSSSHLGGGGGDGDLSVSYSEGEVRNLRKSKVASRNTSRSRGRLLEEWKKSRGAATAVPGTNSAPSPGEFHFPRETRDGIDVINVSRQSSTSFRGDRRTAKTEAERVDSVEDGESSSRRKLRISDSAPVVHVLQPPQLLTVESYSAESVATQITVSEKPSQPVQTSSTEYQKSSTSVGVSEIAILPETPSNTSHLQPRQISTAACLKAHTTAANESTGLRETASQLQPVQVAVRPPTVGQLVTVPTGLVGDEPSASAYSVTYSSDFDFSSLSVPGLD